MSDVTRILDDGDPRAAEQLLPPVYDELRSPQRNWRTKRTCD